MSYSNSLFIASSDNLLGVWMVRQIMKKVSMYGGEQLKVIAGVYSSRSRRAHELFTLGATVIEMNPINESKLHEIAKSAKGVVVIPPLETRPNWYEDMEKCFTCLEEASPQVAVLVSTNGVAMTDNIKTEPYVEIFKKMASVEHKFKQMGEKKKWAIVRPTVPQEFMLHYSRLIQETGILMLPTGSGKCPYISLDDVTTSICMLIMQPKSFNIYTLTGPEPLDGNYLVEKLNQNTEIHISFKSVEPKFAERYLRTELMEPSIALVYAYLGVFELIKSNKLASTTEDLKKLINKEPKKIDELFKEFSQLFKP